MEGGAGAGGGGGGGGSGGPAPFLLKTYEMVDDSSTDAIVSWSAGEASFVVWNPPDFAARLLPTYFKHNNFSSFIRQLNTYGFRKIDPEKWEFSNDFFIKGQKHLLKNIHRRKPIHSHSNPPGSLLDSERAALEEEIDRLSRERSSIEATLLRFKQQQSGARIQIEDLERRLLDMEQRQLKMIAFLQRAMRNPRFRESLVKMAGASKVDFTDAIHKKRRLPHLDYCNEVTENSFFDDHSSTSKPDLGNLFHQDFCDKLKLGLCSAMTESNLVSASTQSSSEDNESPQGKHLHPDCGTVRMECLPLVPETHELSDTGTSLCPTKNDLFSRAAHEDGLFPCHLSLTLASTSMQTESSQHSDRNLNMIDKEDGMFKPKSPSMSRDEGLGRLVGEKQNTSADCGVVNVASLKENATVSNEPPAAPPARVNDVFWEQFLTERPGCCENEEASSSLRANIPCEQPEDQKQGDEDIQKSKKDMENLKL
ncbi:heat stress transcription factor A-5 [Typha angustifolia]|uniref:heat stress transcription factor A-5 n=1 Tax=Typha angustifolia TaxID=59011 RepID=UPI003C2F64D3